MKGDTIYQTHDKTMRILEVFDGVCTLEDLEGDMFNPKANPDLPKEQLDKERQAFIRQVENEGVFGYVLEVWNPSPDCGWEHIDSCFGFVGRHSDHDHYIVQEFIDQIKEREG